MYLSVLICFLALNSESFFVNGKYLSLFLEKYSNALESYIMAGYGQSWKHCDLLSVGSSIYKEKKLIIFWAAKAPRSLEISNRNLREVIGLGPT